MIISLEEGGTPIFCSAALGVATRVVGGSPGVLGDLHHGRSWCCSLQHLPVCARALGRLVELRTHLRLKANFACIESRQSLLSVC